MKVKKEEGAIIIKISGDIKDMEKAETIIKFPTGEVSICRTTNNKYWVHFNVKENAVDNSHESKLSKARLDIRGMSTNDVNVGDFGHPDLYHLAILTE